MWCHFTPWDINVPFLQVTGIYKKAFDPKEPHLYEFHRPFGMHWPNEEEEEEEKGIFTIKTIQDLGISAESLAFRFQSHQTPRWVLLLSLAR